jgi:glycosyltransferase involved in cell wall biosynthesis
VGQASVSVIIPTNRGGAYLAEAVGSVRAQTVEVSEILLVDDGSPPPGLEEAAKALGLHYVRQAPSGIASARNTGVSHAESEWVAFLDDDDVWHPERIAEQMRALENQPDAVACASGGWYMNSDGVRFGNDWWQHPASSRDLLAGIRPFPRITTLTIRRDEYRAVGGCDSTMEPAEDSDLIMRLLQRGEIAVVSRPLVGYRRHDANVSSTGLRGRNAGYRVIAANMKRAGARHDRELSGLLRSNLRAFRRSAAPENLRDVVQELRTRRWGRAWELCMWGITRAPMESIAAALRHVATVSKRLKSPSR